MQAVSGANGKAKKGDGGYIPSALELATQAELFAELARRNFAVLLAYTKFETDHTETVGLLFSGSRAAAIGLCEASKLTLLHTGITKDVPPTPIDGADIDGG